MKKIVALTGAGVSAESGLKTFRDSDGLWEGHDVTQVATPEAFERNPALVQEFYNARRRFIKDAEPNEAHVALAKLQEFYEVEIITQNIDDLHERAGSRHVLHLHGNIFEMHSTQNPEVKFPIKEDIQVGDLAADGYPLRPAIVWFGEAVPAIEEAIEMILQADIFILIGSSLQVYPAAGLVDFVPRNVSKYIIDPKIPITSAEENMFLIAKPATEGMAGLYEELVLRYQDLK